MDHSQNTLTAAIKSLSDGVQPAVDTSDPLATQQLSLVMDYLDFLRGRLPYLGTRARIELRAAQELAGTLREHAETVNAEAGRALESALTVAADVSELAPTSTLETLTARILAAAREVIRSAAGAEPSVRRAIERAVFDDSERMAAFYRSWYLPTGFDPYPDEVRALDDVIAEW